MKSKRVLMIVIVVLLLAVTGASMAQWGGRRRGRGRDRDRGFGRDERAGVPMWEKIGGAMANLGVTFFPVFWGFMAALAEAGGGVCLILGLAARPAAILMAFTMAVAATHHFKAGDGLAGASHALELGIVFAALILIGPGRYSLDRD